MAETSDDVFSALMSTTGTKTSGATNASGGTPYDWVGLGINAMQSSKGLGGFDLIAEERKRKAKEEQERQRRNDELQRQQMDRRQSKSDFERVASQRDRAMNLQGAGMLADIRGEADKLARRLPYESALLSVLRG